MGADRSRWSGEGWLARFPVRFRDGATGRPDSSLTVATLDRLLKEESMLLRSPPRSSEKSRSSSLGGVAVATVEFVCARDRPPGVCGANSPAAGTGGISSAGIVARLFFLDPPNEKVLPALFKKPLPEDLGGGADALGDSP